MNFIKEQTKNNNELEIFELEKININGLPLKEPEYKLDFNNFLASKCDNKIIFNNIELEVYDNNDFNLKDDLNNSQIYVIQNIINNKLYVGKANCFTGYNNKRWGTNSRWASHVNEAFSSKKDHCAVLNNAIRKYNEYNFKIYTICKCPISEISEKEDFYINLLNSKEPNGYNIRNGGDKGKNNPESIKKMIESRKGLVHSEKTKNKISQGQIGNRRNAKARKYEEDNNLPKYIRCQRNNNIISKYLISFFPIGINSVEYLPNITFNVSKYGTKEKALEEAIKKLEELKKEYNYIYDEITNIKEEIKKECSTTNKENKLKNNLPEFIYPILVDNKIAGYYVDGIIDIQTNNLFPKRIFNKKTNRWNLDSSIKFVNILHHINDNLIDMSKFNILKIYPNDIDKSFFEKYYLPKYINVLRKKGVIRGIYINGFPDKKYKDGKFRKDFQTINGKSLDDVYEEAIDYLEELKLNSNEYQESDNESGNESNNDS
jgi:hypothetical protein